MNMRKQFIFLFFMLYSIMAGCSSSPVENGGASSSTGDNWPSTDPGGTNFFKVTVIETSRSGKKHDVVTNLTSSIVDSSSATIIIRPETRYQKIIGIGGSFTEASGYVLSQISSAKRQEILEAYFSTNGAAYTLTRTHIGACDFTLNGKYSYDDVSNDVDLVHFSIAPDEAYLLPLILDSKSIAEASGNSFKVVASPWTPPVWMKNGSGNEGGWYGGSLLPAHYTNFARYISKYITEYKSRGINIWAITPINEPGGNGGSFESCVFGTIQMRDYVNQALGPVIKTDHPEVLILGFDHNRDGMIGWAKTLYPSQYIDGLAVHWYSSTTNTYNSNFIEVYNLDTNRIILHSEGCIDAYDINTEGDWWNDNWWWETNATDWGWDWGNRAIHPKYVPVYRYAVDIIETINSYNMGWIDWNIVLNRQGGPNHVSNWCGAPVLVDTATGEVFYTPIYYLMKQFSRTIRPNSYRIEKLTKHDDLYILAIQNPEDDILMEGKIAVHILNNGANKVSYRLRLRNTLVEYEIEPNTLQTLIIEIL